MNIVIVFDTGRVGGHVLSALTTAHELKRRGHKVTIISGQGDFAKNLVGDLDYCQVTFHHHYCERQTYFSLQSWNTVRALKGYLVGQKIDMIHAFDARSYLACYLVGFLWEKIPLSCTVCGGYSPYYNLPRLASLIVFSDEQKEKMQEVFSWPEAQVRVIRTRLNIRDFIVDDAGVLEQYERFGIDPTQKNIMLISTFLANKVKSLTATFDVIRDVCAKYHDVNFVFIGGRGDFFAEARKIADSINQEMNRKAIIFTGIIPDAYRLLRHAYIVLGQGRSAFEGMAFAKPTVVIGETGYAGIVSPELIEEIAFYNFSGRNKKKFAVNDEFVAELTQLIEHKDYYQTVALFGKNWVYEHIDIAKGIDRIEDVYNQNIAYFKKKSKLSMFADILKIYPNLLIDNYYNRVKFLLLRR